MISPSSKCTQFYKHYKITAVSIPVGGPADGVNITVYTYDPTISTVDPILVNNTSGGPYDTMDEFDTAIQEAINTAYPPIDILIGGTSGPYGTAPRINVDLPDPMERELYDNSTLNNNVATNSARATGSGGILVGPSISTPAYNPNSVVTGQDISGAPGYPQVTHPQTSNKNPYSTSPFSASAYVSAKEMKYQRPQNTGNTKKHRKGLGRNETVADVVNLMARALDSIDGKRMRYVDSQTGGWANESRNNALERLIGLKTSQVPLAELGPDKEVTFTRYVYELIRNKTSSAVIEGKGLVGKELALKYGEELAKYIDILDGDNIAAIRDTGMAQRNTGVEFVPHSTEQNAGIGVLTQESVSGAEKKERTRLPSAFADTQFNQINFRGNIVPPDVFKDIYKPKLGITYEPPMSWLDYLGDRRSRKRDNDAAKSILTLTPAASKMALSDVYFAIANAGNFDIVDSKMRTQDRVEVYNARKQAGGSYFDLLINAKGLEGDPNTVTLRRLAASFAATLLCVKAQCSECRHYKGESSGQSRTNAPDGSATLNAALTCEFGYTDAGGKAKGPESFCGFNETAPANPAMTGIKYDVNDKTSDRIRDARNAIEKDGSQAYLSLMKQYGQESQIQATPTEVAAAAGAISGTTKPPNL